MTAAVFIDRDGVINELKSYEEGDKREYVLSKEDIKLIDNVTSGMEIFSQEDVKIIIVSNQSPIGRGFITEEEFKKVSSHIKDLIVEKGGRIDGVYYCPHIPLAEGGIDCECRKPKPGLLFKAAQEHGIDLEKSYMIGDRSKDIEAGKNANVKKTIGVRTGYGCKDGDIAPDFMANDLLEAAKYIKGDLE